MEVVYFRGKKTSSKKKKLIAVFQRGKLVKQALTIILLAVSACWTRFDALAFLETSKPLGCNIHQARRAG